MKNFILIVCLAISGRTIAQEEAYAEASDHSIFYKKFGTKGTPVLIINGGPGMNSRGFETVARGISELNCQSIIYDQRGTGKSKMEQLDTNSITMDRMIADIEALRQHFGFEKWVVLGHSFGGLLANYYATVHPERVQAIIGSSSGGVDLQLLRDFDITRHLTPTQRDSLSFYSRKISEGDTSAATRLKRLRFFAAAYVVNDENVEKLIYRMQQVNQTINSLVWQNLRSINFDCKPKLKSFQKPVLIIQGDQDIISNELAEVALKTFPNASKVVLKDCGHFGWVEQPEKYYASLATFLKDLN